MTGTNAGTASAAVTAIAFLSISSTASDATTIAANPVVAGTASFEKHLRFYIETAPATSIGNYKIWTTTAAQANVALRAKGSVGTAGASPGTGDSTPVNTAMTSDVSLYAYPSSAAAYVVDSTVYTGAGAAAGQVSKAFILQLQPASNAAAGDWATHTIGYSYEEV